MRDRLSIAEAVDNYLPDVDGVVNCVHNYCLNLSTQADVTVFAPENRKDHAEALPYRTIRCKSMRLPVFKQYYGFPAIDDAFKKRAYSKSFDIVHVHSPCNMARFALKMARDKDIPIVGTYHSNMSMIMHSSCPFPFVTKLVLRRFAKLYNRFDEMFVCSSLVEEQLREIGYTGKISRLPFGTDFEKCGEPEMLSRQADGVFGIGEEELVFIYIGRITKLKRIDFILRALKIVKDSGLSFRFYAVGKGPDLDRLRHLAAKLGFNDKEVCFTGYLPRENLPILSARADLLLFPSLYDNFGLVKVECAAYETPGVFIESSCAGDGIIQGENGFLSGDDEEAFAETIMEAVRDRGKLKLAGRRARDELYIHWSACTELLLDNYQRIIAEYKRKKESQK